ncbi:hypothetical protein AB1046_20300 [Promicromonospora sp. Populi]|uniref:hypothetical protein n=1 Tax=Promicromonospora sp. Populi TaxID=3239420 RepID=UPI0034E19898
MTEHKNDDNIQSEIPSRPEGQDTSEDMDHKTTNDPDTTEVLPTVLPAAATPPTQEIATHEAETREFASGTQRIPEGTAPEGEVHPAYGVAAAQVTESAAAESAASAVQDAPAVAAVSSSPGTGLTQPVAPVHQGQSAQQGRPAHHGQSAQQGQSAQPATPATERRRARVGTAVWGLIVIAVGLGILAVSAGVIFDLGMALIVLLGAAGVILVVGSVVSSLRRR